MTATHMRARSAAGWRVEFQQADVKAYSAGRCLQKPKLVFNKSSAQAQCAEETISKQPALFRSIERLYRCTLLDLTLLSGKIHQYRLFSIGVFRRISVVNAPRLTTRRKFSDILESCSTLPAMSPRLLILFCINLT